MAIKAIALDIDGTLTNDEKVITPRTRRAYSTRRADGISVDSAHRAVGPGPSRLASELEVGRRMAACLVSFKGARGGRADRRGPRSTSPCRGERPCARSSEHAQFRRHPVDHGGRNRLYVERGCAM
ncbi:MAG: HAD family hydrolase [Collinsella sp.]